MKWVYMAWLNLGRNGRRTVASLMLTAVAVLGLMNSNGFADYTLNALRDASIREHGHLVLSHARYFQQQQDVPMQWGLADYQPLQQRLRQDQGVAQVYASVAFDGLISNGETSTIFIGDGIEIGAQEPLRLQSSLSMGQLLSTQNDSTADPQVLLGEGLARNLGAQPGDYLTLLSTTTQGALNALDVQVVGIINTGVPEMDSRLVITELAYAQELLLTNKASKLAVHLQADWLEDSYFAQISREFPELGVSSWQEHAHYYHNVAGLYERIFGVLGLILMMMVVFAIFNTASMSVLERTREIGTLAAMGTKRREILWLLLLEAAFLAAIGAAIGLALAALVSQGLNWAQIPMPPAPGQSDSYPLLSYWSLATAVQTTLTLMVLAMLAAFIASWNTLRKPIVEALNHV